MFKKIFSGSLSILLVLSMLNLCAIFNLPNISLAKADVGWLTGWYWRKSHIINSAVGAGANYQVKIVAHYGSGIDDNGDLFCNSKCKTDFGDIRFTRSDGITLLDYWLESKIDSDNAVFWVEIAEDLSSSNATIYIYYGKMDARTASSGDNTFIFFDDFEDENVGDAPDLNKWITNGTDASDTIKVANDTAVCGNKILEIHESGDSILTYVISKEWTDSGTVAIGYRFRRDGDFTSWDWYVYDYIFKEGSGNALVTCIIEASSNEFMWYDDKMYHKFSPSIATSKDTWCTLEWKCLDESMVLNVNGTDTIGGYRSAFGNPRSFKPWFFAPKEVNRSAFVDNVYVRKYVSPEPSQGSWGNEERILLLVGDVNADGKIDIFDIVEAATAFGATPNSPFWNPQADIYPDGLVDIFDLVIVAAYFGKTS